MNSIEFFIDFPGEKAAGLRPLTDTVTISCASGDWGDRREFEEYMTKCLADWYDGAGVTVLGEGPTEWRDKS